MAQFTSAEPPQMATAEIEIAPVQRHEITETVAFVLQARAAIFPQLAAAPMPADLKAFAQAYLQAPQGHFLAARSHGQLIGVIGYLPYDHRFAQLDYRGRNTVEVVRLFVLPQYRGAGVASALFQKLAAEASNKGVDVLYLHTHPFLPGAIRFWERQGFQVTNVEADPIWRTTHMERTVKG